MFDSMPKINFMEYLHKEGHPSHSHHPPDMEDECQLVEVSTGIATNEGLDPTPSQHGVS